MSTETTAEIVNETESTFDLIAAGKINAIELYSEGGIDPLTAKVREEVSNFKADVTTAKGRSAIASMGHKVARTKTAIDEMGKNITAEKKAECKKIDQARKSMRDEFDQIRDEVKKPLIEWKEAKAAEEQKIIDDAAAEKTRLEEVEAARIAQEKAELEKQQAELAERERVFKAKEDAAEAERLQKERDEKTAADAKALAEREAQEAINREKAAAEQVKKDAAEKIQRAKDYALNQEIETARKHKAELERVKQEANRKEQERNASEKERQRLINVENARIEAERIAKAANVEHMREINKQALCDFIKHGMTEDLARKVVVFIASNKISNVTINY